MTAYNDYKIIWINVVKWFVFVFLIGKESMAKKPKVSGRGYAVFMIGIIAFVIMEPVVLFGAVFYFVWKMYQIKLSGETDYWLSKDEKEYFLSALEEWRMLFSHKKVRAESGIIGAIC